MAHSLFSEDLPLSRGGESDSQPDISDTDSHHSQDNTIIDMEAEELQHLHIKIKMNASFISNHH